MVIREVEGSDIERVIELIHEIDATSEYMLYEAGERNFNAPTIERIMNSPSDKIFVAEKDQQLVGYVFAICGKARRNRHTAYLVIGIRKNNRGEGIGTSLLQALEKWALENKLHRLELTVAVRNKAGISLYKKMGFETEGVKHDSLFVDGEYVDEYYMGKLL